MPTLNPQLQISTSCVRNLSRYRNEAKEETATLTNEDHSAAPSNSSISSVSNTANTFVNSNSMSYDDYLQRKVNELRTHVNSNKVQRNASDTDTSLLLSTCEEESECSEEESITNLNQLSNTNRSERVIDPSLVPGNLRNARVKSTSKILEEFLSRGSVESTQGNINGRTQSRENIDGNTDSLKVSKITTKRKPTRFTSSKQQTNKQKERINSTVPDIHITTCNILSKSVSNNTSGRGCPAVEDRVPHFKGCQIRGKVNSDLSINVAPYSQKSSKDHLSPYQCSSSAARIKNWKRTANSFERVVRRKASQTDEQMRLKKVYLTKIQPNRHTGVGSQQPSSKHDQHSSCENDSVLADIKHRGFMHQTPQLEAKASQRERTNGEENRQAETLPKVMRHELKRKQRREIYALNKVMTDLENERFVLFMQDVGANTGSI